VGVDVARLGFVDGFTRLVIAKDEFSEWCNGLVEDFVHATAHAIVFAADVATHLVLLKKAKALYMNQTVARKAIVRAKSSRDSWSAVMTM